MINKEWNFIVGKKYSLEELRKLKQCHIYLKDENLYLFDRTINDVFTCHNICEKPIIFNGLEFKTQEHLYKWFAYHKNEKAQKFFCLNFNTSAQDIKDLRNFPEYKYYSPIYWNNRGLLQAIAMGHKLKCNKPIQELLLSTKNKNIVHLCEYQKNRQVSKEDFEDSVIDIHTVFGVDNYYIGLNCDGRILMKFRECLTNGTFENYLNNLTEKGCKLFGLENKKE